MRFKPEPIKPYDEYEDEDPPERMADEEIRRY